MKYLVLILGFLVFTSCKNEDNFVDTSVPSCINDLLDQDVLEARSILTVRVQKLGTDHHYWLNTGFRAFDGIEYIVDTNCDTVCSLCGFCIPETCSEFYPIENWQIIWQK